MKAIRVRENIEASVYEDELNYISWTPLRPSVLSIK